MPYTRIYKSRKLEISFFHLREEHELLIIVQQSLEKAKLNKLHECVNGKYREYLLIASIVSELDEVLNNAEIKLRITGPLESIFFVLKRAIWREHRNSIFVEVHHPVQYPENLYELYMYKFSQALRYSSILQDSNSDNLVSNFQISNIYNLNSDVFDTLYTYDLYESQPTQSRHLINPKVPYEDSIDFIIPTRNVSMEDLLTCIHSIIVQMKPQDKIIVVDDNDDDMNLIKSDLQNRFPAITVVRGNRTGIANARNIGLAQGENALVSFIDSDDFISGDFVEVQRKFHHKHFSVCATGTWLQSFGSYTRTYPQWDNIAVLGVLYCLPPAGVLMWKRDAIEKLGKFDSEFANGYEDYDLTARASAMGFPIVVLDEALYYYRRGHNSLTSSINVKQESNLYLEVISRNILKMHPKHRKTALRLIRIYGKKIPTNSHDLISNLLNRSQLISIYDILITKLRISKRGNNSYSRFPAIFRPLTLSGFRILCNGIDFLYYRGRFKKLKKFYKI